MRIQSCLLVFAFGLAGCAGRGNEVLKSQNASTVNLSIVDGKTTRDEVQRIYGGPTHSSYSSDKNEIWTYTWSHRAPQVQNFIPVVGLFTAATDIQKKQLIILFNDQNVVIKHSMTESNEAIRREFSSSATPTAR